MVIKPWKELVAPVASGADIVIIAPNSFRPMSSIVSIVSLAVIFDGNHASDASS
ncbi:hypothetical protein [Rhodopseudomonas palustris]|uniref:hypothetical protein n=1 Tax=Rhodopseudomonas palustris TaxID=1076 RepID=UPI001600AE8B|nr:hypothetical protein [Rhodopseudomonas palustris]